MIHKKVLIGLNSLALVIIVVAATAIGKYFWVDPQQTETQNKSLKNYSLVKPTTLITEKEIEILKKEIKGNRKDLKDLTHKIETQLTQLQTDINYLFDSQNNKIEILKKEIKSNRKDLSHKIETQLTQLQTDINYLFDNQNNKYGNSEMDDEFVTGDMIVNSITPASENEKSEKEKVESMEKMLQDHDSDPKWSIAAERSIHEVFTGDEINGIQLESAECGSTLCQANFYFDGASDIDDAFYNIIDRIPWSGQSFAQIDEESGNMEFYLAREGHNLQNPEDEATHQ